VADRLERFTFQQAGRERLDIFLASCLPEFSRSRLQGLIRDGFVAVDGSPVTKAGRDLDPGARVEVRIPPPQPAGLLAAAIPLEILFENADLLVVNKPAGMVVHPAPGHERGTLVHAVLAHVPELEGIGGEERPGIVHRLDKETSGLILVAKNERSHRWLQEQFKARTVEKTFFALVDGRPPTPSGRVEAPIGRSTSHRKLMSVLPEGKGREAVSEYRTLESFPAYTLLEVHPLTGRTHQIRLHLAFLGCPVAGDAMYGHKRPTLPLGRHFLHAYMLKVMLPGENKARIFEAGLPGELQQVLDQVRSRV